MLRNKALVIKQLYSSTKTWLFNQFEGLFIISYRLLNDNLFCTAVVIRYLFHWNECIFRSPISSLQVAMAKKNIMGKKGGKILGRNQTEKGAHHFCMTPDHYSFTTICYKAGQYRVNWKDVQYEHILWWTVLKWVQHSLNDYSSR